MTDPAPYRYASELAFRLIDPQADGDLLVEFGRQLYIESLGSDAAFKRDFGVFGQKFPLWIATCIAENPKNAAFLTADNVVVAMVVVGRDRRDNRVGHVHHFFVAQAHRGRGIGGLLDDYARDVLRKSGFTLAKLNVTAQNNRALRFYLAQGWRDVTTKNSKLRIMEVDL